MRSSCYQHAPNCVSRKVAGETVIVKTPEGTLTVLNESAGVIWSAADGSRSAGELATAMAEHYRLAAAPDIRGFLEALASKGLLMASAQGDASPAPSLGPSTASPYTEPSILAHEPLETLAGICGSGFGSYGDCRLDGGCINPFD